ncbi:DUF2487 family protein [Paenibacillus sp. PL2-23]|uniref:DUF2487 family protein n=1 Tax=Paenibacillus sp. PL2-23 TaxID=2100729 RepID=UPI0030F6167D
MKFSDISREQWDELKPYLDTCLLPVTGLDGSESPYEATEKLERLRDMLDLIEIPFKGRVVTYPACHYVTPATRACDALADYCANLRASGFAVIVFVSADASLQLQDGGADLIIQPAENGEWPSKEAVSTWIRELWSRTAV